MAIVMQIIHKLIASWLITCLLCGHAWSNPLPFGKVNAACDPAVASCTPPKPCPDSGYCFKNAEEKKLWAHAHDCVFVSPKVECEDKEVKPEGVVAKAKATVRFADGLIDGLKQQITDLWTFFKTLFSNPGEVWEGLKTLGKLIIEDPKGAIDLFLALLGEDAAKLIECGAYDQGKVIGKYVSPFFALKVAQIVARGGKLADAVKKVKNLILTPAEKARLGIKYIPGVKQPDGRSWFDVFDIKKRGKAIEDALGNNTPDAFPVIDIFNKATGEVTSIKSKSPATAYWAKEGGLRDSIKADLKPLAKFVEDGKPVSKKWEVGTPEAGEVMTVEANKVISKTLLVAVKRGTLTERHYAEIRQAQEYANTLVEGSGRKIPITIKVVEID